MSAPGDDLSHLKKGTAVLAACVVQTLSESDPSFQERFLSRLALAYRQLKDDADGDVHHELELLAWTRELLTGFNLITGQGKPFLAD
jgi:hypothetical protein